MQIDCRLEELKKYAEQIQAQKWIPFKNLTPKDLPQKGGVYVIADGSEVLYVGQTTDLQRRLYTNHLMGNASTARLKKYLSEDLRRPDIPDLPAAKTYLREHCRFKCLFADDARLRGLIESGLLFVFDAPYVDTDR